LVPALPGWEFGDVEFGNVVAQIERIYYLDNEPIHEEGIIPRAARLDAPGTLYGLSNFVRRLLTGYAIRYNRRHLRHGNTRSRYNEGDFKESCPVSGARKLPVMRELIINRVLLKFITDHFEVHHGTSPS